MRRFFCPPENISKDKIIIDDPRELRHLVRVMRLREGDEIIVFDGEGNEYIAEICSVSKNMVVAVNLRAERRKSPDFHITLACALPKKGKFDFIVEKATELGVERIIPLETKRTETKIRDKDICAKIERWKAIALSAAKQSQRNTLPEITGVKGLKQVFTIDKFDLVLMPALTVKRKRITEILTPHFKGNILIIIGPEGDFTPEEVSYAEAKGAQIVSLGKNVLKVETAAIVTLAVVNNIAAV